MPYVGSSWRSGGRTARLRQISSIHSGRDIDTGGMGTRTELRRHPPGRCMPFQPSQGFQLS
jgi:hypothetical protein